MSRDQIIKEVWFEEFMVYRHEFLYKDHQFDIDSKVGTIRRGSAGFSFDVDENGNLLRPNPDAEENYRKCKCGELPVVDCGIHKMEWSYRHPAILRCHCGDTVELSGFTNTCDKCGADYNSAGQTLAPRDQWGEETGESLADILQIQ